jgi:hypothetical protein
MNKSGVLTVKKFRLDVQDIPEIECRNLTRGIQPTEGGLMMTSKSKLLLLLCVFTFLWHPLVVSTARAEVDWKVTSTLNLDKTPIDVVSSSDGKSLFVLTEGEVQIYTQGGKNLSGRIPVDKGVDQLAVSPRGDQLYLTNSKTNSLSIVSVAFVHNIDVAGAPFKGPANAPVVIAVFDDYQ